MLKYIARRVLALPFTLLGGITLSFFLIRFLPGEPFFVSERTSQTYIQTHNQAYGLNLPWFIQYWDFLTKAVHLDFGTSFFADRPVIDIIWQHFANSIQLILVAYSVVVVLGIGSGILTGMGQNSWIDRIINGITVVLYSIPDFVIATGTVFIFRWWTLTLNLRDIPVGGWGDATRGEPPTFLQVIVPAIILGLRPIALISRMTRSQIIETKNQDYVRTAYSKGLNTQAVTQRHILRNSLIPVATTLGTIFASILVSTPVVEIVFRVPGLGSYFVNSIISLDYPVVVGITCFYTLIIVCINLIVDLSYMLIDPKIR